MIIAYLRSSSIGTLDFCEMKYFLTYTLGMKDKTNKKACLGTIFHRAMQVLGDKKIAQLNGKRKVINDDIPDLTFSKCDNLDHVTKLCFDYYSAIETELDFTPADLKLCRSWVHKAVAHNGGRLDPRNQNVYITEKFFDIEIPHEWAKFDYEIDGKIISGNLSIKGTVDLIIDEGNGYFQVLDYKGLPIDTKIPTPNGWSTMGDLMVGDIVFDQYGNKTRVTAKSSQKFKECYEITFDDTSRVLCDDEHYWKLSNGDVVQISELRVGDYINTAKPIECNAVDLPIDPYVLGIWLGDGRNRGGEVTSKDEFVFDEIKRRGFNIGENLEKRHSGCQSKTIFGLTKQLKKLKLTHNKHIPDIYLRASYQQRLDLLRGLMDSDGSVNSTRKQCVFMNCNEVLSDNVKSLLLTLGQRPLKSKTIAKGFGLEVDAFPVSFRPIEINPFLLPTKANKVDINWGPGNSDKRRVTKIEKQPIRLTQCISVDSSDHTYLCTENMIPTHNTGKRLNWATGKEKTYSDLQKDPQLLLYYYALKNVYPDKDFYMSIYYVNDGGVFDVIFTQNDYAKAEKMLQQKFQYIQSVSLPKQLSKDQSHWKCQKLCKFSEIFESTGKTTCQFIHDEIKSNGIDSVTATFGDLDRVTKYGAGGGRLEGANE